MVKNTIFPVPPAPCLTLSAIIWDYDGTLVDSYMRNFAVTKDILDALNLTFDKNRAPIALRSIEEYKKADQLAKNWRELYIHHFGLTQAQTDKAGSLWSAYQQRSEIEPEIFKDIPAVIRKLGFVPQGICSQNCSGSISEFLKEHNIRQYFKSIIGYKDVPLTEQKPNSTAFIRCFESMQLPFNGHGVIIYIGDHEQDMQLARNAGEELKKRNCNIHVLGVATCYNGTHPDKWSVVPDYCARTPADIIDIIRQVDNRQFLQHHSGEDT